MSRFRHYPDNDPGGLGQVRIEQYVGAVECTGNKIHESKRAVSPKHSSFSAVSERKSLNLCRSMTAADILWERANHTWQQLIMRIPCNTTSESVRILTHHVSYSLNS